MSRSDIDIAIFPKRYPFEDYGRFWLDIEDIDTLLRSDIVVIDNDTDKELIENIKREGIMIYEKS